MGRALLGWLSSGGLAVVRLAEDPHPPGAEPVSSIYRDRT